MQTSGGKNQQKLSAEPREVAVKINKICECDLIWDGWKYPFSLMDFDVCFCYISISLLEFEGHIRFQFLLLFPPCGDLSFGGGKDAGRWSASG